MKVTKAVFEEELNGFIVSGKQLLESYEALHHSDKTTEYLGITHAVQKLLKFLADEYHCE